MIPKIAHYHKISARVNYALSEGRDKNGKLKRLEPGQERRTEIIGSQGFEYEVLDRDTAEQARIDMERNSYRDYSPADAEGKRGYTESPCLELDLCWAPHERPDSEHMAETSRSALKALGMERALAVFFRHKDTEHPHVHVVASRHQPGSRGRELFSDSDDQYKMAFWAQEYEDEHGYVRANTARVGLRRARAAGRESASELAERERQLNILEQNEAGNKRSLPLDRSWLQSTELFEEFAQAKGLGKINQREVDDHKQKLMDEKLFRGHFNDIEPEPKPAAEREHEHHNGSNLPNLIPNPAVSMINRAFSDYEAPGPDELAIRGRELTFERQITEHKPRDVVQEEASLEYERERPNPSGEGATHEISDDGAIDYAAKKERQRGGGRERSIFDDGSQHGQSGYGGD